MGEGCLDVVGFCPGLMLDFAPGLVPPGLLSAVLPPGFVLLAAGGWTACAYESCLLMNQFELFTADAANADRT